MKAAVVVLLFAVIACSSGVDAINSLKRERARKECKGTCQIDSRPCIKGTYVSGLCPGSKNVRCCQPNAEPAKPQTNGGKPPSYVGHACSNAQGKGTCQKVVPHGCEGGAFVGGLCPGGDDIKCCIPKPAAVRPPTPTPVQPPVVRPPTPSPVQPPVVRPPTPAPASTKKCTGDIGICQADNLNCEGGSYKNNMCPGTPNNVRCCFPNGGGMPSPTHPNAPPADTPIGPRGLPSFKGLWAAYPGGEADEVKQHIGGGINADYITNTCVIRVSRALIGAGVRIEPFTLKNGQPMLLVKGGDGNKYALRVKEFKEYMLAKYGKPAIVHVNDGNGDGEEAPAVFKGKKGIMMFDVRVWNDASGHFDLWDGKDSCAHECYFDKAKEVWLWPIA